jgi:diacylglycerol kinase
MTEEEFQVRRSWVVKFRDAFRGLALGVRQRSFAVHLPAAVAVVVCGFVLRVDLVEWGLLGLCITAVLVTEMFNSALESMAKAVDRHHNPQLEVALNIGSAAVLTAALGAAAVGGTIFVYRFAVLWTA